MLEGKKIVLGITGGIAAYKSCFLARELIRRGAEVQTVLTPAAKEFVTPLTLSTLTRHPVVSEFFDRRDGSWHSHVDLGLWADAMIVAPATANTIGKMAHGIADNMLVTTYLSMKAPVFVAPAMDLDMYAHPTTEENLQRLVSHGVHIIEPGTGFLASQLEGKGRMEEPDKIADVIDDFFAPKDLQGKNILVTAGPTYEKIDPVRFIGNYSSGKMGFALAEECARRGAHVELVCGPVSLQTKQNISRTDVESANEMYEATVSRFENVDAAILCAAVADFTPIEAATQKIKRKGDQLTLTLKPTHDIAAELGRRKRHQRLVGFALETNDEQTHAHEKLQKKNLDLIVLNSLRDEGAGFRVDTNKVTLITPQAETPLPLLPKTDVAREIVNSLAKLLNEK